QQQSNYSQKPPHPYTPYPYPSNPESQIHLEESVKQFNTTLHQLKQTINQLSSRYSDTQQTPITSCKKSNKKHNIKKTLKTPVNSIKHNFVLKQIENAVI
ncbi:hypothetical protein DF186_14715, partial [Enterococcus hirae]